VVTHRVRSIGELRHLLRGIGWTEVIVLPGRMPDRLVVWESGDHWHARVDYVSAGTEISLVQAEGEGLPPGQLVEIRGEYGVRSDSGLYWPERDFIVALSPGRRGLAAELRWVRT
jgi:hypothetical protein